MRSRTSSLGRRVAAVLLAAVLMPVAFGASNAVALLAFGLAAVALVLFCSTMLDTPSTDARAGDRPARGVDSLDPMGLWCRPLVTGYKQKMSAWIAGRSMPLTRWREAPRRLRDRPRRAGTARAPPWSRRTGGACAPWSAGD